MIRIKTKEEIEVLRQGGKLLANILDKVIEEAKSGANTEDLENLACQMIKDAHGRPSFKEHGMHNGEVFPSALCISINDEIVHVPAVPNRVLKEGDIVGIDIGMEYPIGNDVLKIKGNPCPKNEFSKLGGYYTDMSRTIAVGKVSKEAEKLIKITKECLELGIAQVKPGNTLSNIGRVIQEHAESNGFGVVRDLVGHGVGHDVHEDPHIPNYEIDKNSPENFILQPGMVIAIEPMINIGTGDIMIDDDGLAVRTADGELSAHFEHTVAVTDDGYEILTKN